MDKITEDLIGTPEAAVRSCVSLVAAVTAQREELIAFWLDLYYQVRTQYEKSRKTEGDTISRKELAAMMRDLMQQTLQGEAPGRTSKKAEKKPPEKKPAPRDSAFKREVATRLDAAKKRGITVAQIAAAADEGQLTEGEILSILERKIMPPELYHELDIALARLEA